MNLPLIIAFFTIQEHWLFAPLAVAILSLGDTTVSSCARIQTEANDFSIKPQLTIHIQYEYDVSGSGDSNSVTFRGNPDWANNRRKLTSQDESKLMGNSEILEHLVCKAKCYPAARAESEVPTGPGYYSICIDSADSLIPPFDDLLRWRKTHLIYIGIATVNLYYRLVQEDLRHKRPSTFFRGIGAVLHYRPIAGSLVGKKNQRNYRFERQDTEAIIEWINTHLSIRWTEANPVSKKTEVFVISQCRPLLNTKDNPEPVHELATLRRECERIAANKT